MAKNWSQKIDKLVEKQQNLSKLIEEKTQERDALYDEIKAIEVEEIQKCMKQNDLSASQVLDSIRLYKFVYADCGLTIDDVKELLTDEKKEKTEVKSDD